MMSSDTAAATIHKRRSERVFLTMRLALSARAPDGRATSQEAQSQVVNAHGGLLVTQMDIVAGQEFVLTNPKTGMAKRCRVVRAERLETTGLSVAFQFDEPAPKFWPVDFPPPDWAASNINA
ncbi:MAG: hypothetical protein M3P45_14555 [Acidobacteriota bacterium]|nr:hypothetical protein [Acidobacteriota bacterium]